MGVKLHQACASLRLRAIPRMVRERLAPTRCEPFPAAGRASMNDRGRSKFGVASMTAGSHDPPAAFGTVFEL
jgi:hypothetical protein